MSPLDLSRREFLAAGAAGLTLAFVDQGPPSQPKPASWFVGCDASEAWQVDDPVQWALSNARRPVLRRAARGLQSMSPIDDDRVIRLVVRRCSLNLVEVFPGSVVVHHWSQTGLADLKPFFKQQRLAKADITVFLKNRKAESGAEATGEDFLFGDALGSSWPIEQFVAKWSRRFEEEADDSSAAPFTRSGFAWEGLKANQIPWAALKSAWRHSEARDCRNCDRPTVLVNFGRPQTSFFSRTPQFIEVCGTCRRSFTDTSIADVRQWMVDNLDAAVFPTYDTVWGRPVPWR
jgi:hypothetical protein